MNPLSWFKPKTAAPAAGVSTVSSPSALTNLLNFIKGTLEVDLLPVAGGAVAVLQKSPNAAGVAAAQLYILGNAPVALLTAEGAGISTALSDLSAEFAKLEAQGAATVAAATAAS